LPSYTPPDKSNINFDLDDNYTAPDKTDITFIMDSVYGEVTLQELDNTGSGHVPGNYGSGIILETLKVDAMGVSNKVDGDINLENLECDATGYPPGNWGNGNILEKITCTGTTIPPINGSAYVKLESITVSSEGRANGGIGSCSLERLKNTAFSGSHGRNELEYIRQTGTATITNIASGICSLRQIKNESYSGASGSLKLEYLGTSGLIIPGHINKGSARLKKFIAESNAFTSVDVNGSVILKSLRQINTTGFISPVGNASVSLSPLKAKATCPASSVCAGQMSLKTLKTIAISGKMTVYGDAYMKLLRIKQRDATIVEEEKEEILKYIEGAIQ